MKLAEKQKMNIDFIVKSKNGELITIDNVKIVTYEVDVRGVAKPAAAIFVGNAFNAESRYFYRSIEARQEEIDRVVAREKSRATERQKKIDARKAFVPTAKAGDIFVSSWGYEQTNVDFFLLESIKGKTGTFVKIGQYQVEGSEGSGGMSCEVMPSPETIIGERFTKRIGVTMGTESFMNDSKYVAKWSGKSKYKSWYY